MHVIQPNGIITFNLVKIGVGYLACNLHKISLRPTCSAEWVCFLHLKLKQCDQKANKYFKVVGNLRVGLLQFKKAQVAHPIPNLLPG